MKTFLRIGAVVISLGLAGLFAGCSSYSSYADRRQPARDFEVVETSTKRQLTEAEMAYLRAKVRDYLVQQGQTGSGDYYLKVYLGEESGVEEGEWVIVRYTRYPAGTYNVVSSSPTYWYPSYGYSSLDYYPFGFFGLSALSFRYYDYPYYYGSGYYPRYYRPTWTGGRWPDHKRWHDRRDHNDKDRDGDRPRVGGGRPSGALKPSFVPANVGRTPWNGSSGSSTGDFRRRDDRVNRWDHRPNGAGDNAGTRRWSERQDRNSPNHRPAYTPSSVQSGNPASAPSYRPATRSNLHRERGDSGYSRPNRSEAARRECATASPRAVTARRPAPNPQAHRASRRRATSRRARPRAARNRPATPRIEPTATGAAAGRGSNPDQRTRTRRRRVRRSLGATPRRGSRRRASATRAAATDSK
jgi:hypothetical protein